MERMYAVNTRDQSGIEGIGRDLPGSTMTTLRRRPTRWRTTVGGQRHDRQTIDRGVYERWKDCSPLCATLRVRTLFEAMLLHVQARLRKAQWSPLTCSCESTKHRTTKHKVSTEEGRRKRILSLAVGPADKTDATWPRGCTNRRQRCTRTEAGWCFMCASSAFSVKFSVHLRLFSPPFRRSSQPRGKHIRGGAVGSCRRLSSSMTRTFAHPRRIVPVPGGGRLSTRGAYKPFMPRKYHFSMPRRRSYGATRRTKTATKRSDNDQNEKSTRTIGVKAR
jgi:hypothetical protein